MSHKNIVRVEFFGEKYKKAIYPGDRCDITGATVTAIWATILLIKAQAF